MRKRFVKAVLYGALALTTSTSLVGCKDYDDDVKNLQEQIDHITKGNPVSPEEMKAAIASAIASLQSQLETAIAGKADNAAVIALQQKVQELATELNGKADETRLTELAGEIKALSEQVNGVKGSLEETRKVLEAEIASLKQQLANTADKAQMEKLAKELAALQNKLDEVTKSTEDNAAAIIDLKTKITELEALKSRIDALEAAHQEFARTSDLNAYTKTEEMAGLINNEIAAQLKDNGAIARYVNEVITAKITAEVNSINDRLDIFQRDLDNLATKLDQYNTANSEIAGRLETLEGWKEKLMKALTDAGFDSFADLFGQINKLKEDYAKCITTDNFKTELETMLAGMMKDNESAFGKLAQRVETLEKEVDALKNIVQSIVFIPENRTGEVLFTTLNVNGGNGPQLVARSNTQVKFRISPAEAAQGFVGKDKKYDVTLDAQAITRAAGIFEVSDARLSEVPGEEGIVIYTLKANTDNAYAVCLRARKSASATGEDYTDISSNYFPAISQPLTMTDAQISYVKAPASKIYWDNNKSAVNFLEAASYVYQITAAGQTTELSSLGIDGATIFTNQITPEGNDAGSFKMESGVLTLRSYTAEMEGKSVDVYSTLTLKSPAGFSYKTKLGTVTASQTIPDSKVVTYSGELSWNGTKDQHVYCALEKMSKETGIIISEIESNYVPNMTVQADNGVKFETNVVSNPDVNGTVLNGKFLQITVPSGLKEGTYNPQAILKSGVRSITVKASIGISYPDVAGFIKSGKLWSGDNVGITPVYDNITTAGSITLSQDLTTIFSNYEAIKTAVEKVGGKVSFSSLARFAAGVTLDENGFITIDVPEYTESPFKCAVIASFGNHVASKQVFNVSPAGMSGTWKNGKATVTASKNSPVKLLDGFSWNDERSKKMWADGAIVAGDNKNGFATSVTNVLDLYGLSVPEVAIVDSEYAKYFTYDPAKNEISITEEGKTHKFTESVPVQVKVSVASKWGDLKGDLTGKGGNFIITVTLPADK